ncbi:uncharacterized protein DDB_G0283697-like [Micropterus salmoides]|uniref:uncharacterized protein DDB_G0283697-like n=1 Tax=Micropterus salmoides TaxID=27706 RepID=UPI0018EB163B|nr:uncharacterized protein DDB_G0283697-like [Micropterus salmoides]
MGHSDVVTRPPKVHDGLSNQGGTCSLNSDQQVFSKTPEVHERERPTDPEGQTDDAAERQDESSNKLVQDEGKHTEVEEEDEDEEKREMGHSDVVIWPQKVHDGLSNQGGTCSLNSDQQVFSKTPEVHERERPTDPEGQTDDAAERQDESSNKLVQDEGKHTEVEEEDEDEEKREMGHSDVVTRPQKVHDGLSNQGGTCSLNSDQQVFSKTPEVHERERPTDPEGQTDDAAERQDESSNKLVQDEGKHTEVEEEDEDEEKREMGHSDVVIWPQKVHDGLSNQGGTCSLNSDQQVFSKTPEVHERERPTDPEGQTDDAAERQDESSNKLVQDEEKHTEVEEEDEDEEKREMGHSDDLHLLHKEQE